MDIFELSNRFDVKLNSFSSSADTKTNENLYNIKLDEYEKSLLLTEAQNTIFKAIYLSGSETDESSRKALSKLLRVAKCDQLSVNQTNLDNSKRFKLPLDVAFINQENVRVFVSPLRNHINSSKAPRIKTFLCVYNGKPFDKSNLICLPKTETRL